MNQITLNDNTFDLFEPEIELPLIFQIGDNFYIRATSYDTREQSRTEIKQVTKQTLKDRYGIKDITTIPYFETECYVPAHTGYKPVIENSFNSYHPLPIKPKKGDYSTWEKLIRHIGQDKYEIVLNYLIVLFQYPTEKLPVIIFASKENETGKSTFMQSVAYLLGNNAGIFGQDDLNSQFNTWIMNLLAVFEEISDTKKSINKLKAISTAAKTTVNRKFMPQFSFEPFVKIMIASNDEDTCIHLNEEDTRYLVLKPEKIKDFDPDFDNKLKEEAPAMLWYLLNTEPTIKKQSRIWFTAKDIQTEQFNKIVETSRSPIYQDIRLVVDEIMTEDNLTELYITASELAGKLGNRYALNEITTCLRKEFKLYNTLMRYTPYMGLTEKVGRPYLFKAANQ
ncbi:primase-helicase family protein [Dysgonomonas macrotermitis]|uniref:NrS-1 polymerase-like helicase domain-containing protein n=1 Tax=Dysgonomonas macrotermitis TaxID=1346286 RepID=A0A1M5GMA9_9BACT|nr:primase-helicase family protein [Dysgonomonas macrotermitis]SHG04864.1 hypothetical protein SAMN05444362_11463 [Dysgonomonas macrotermitis]